MSTALNPRLRFDTLVVGAANRLAATAARAVADQPGALYNPLLIYAPPGLGKTHLLMAIGHQAREVGAATTVEYLTFDDFSERYRKAIASGQPESWRAPFLAADVLLVDDVQFLAGQLELQAELLRLVDALQRENRQIVLTSDRPPHEIGQLDERLVRRFAGGLVVDIARPDFETRVAILRRKADERHSSFMGGVLEEVARGSMDSVRELLGVFNKLVAMQAVTDGPVNLEQARNLVKLPASSAPMAAPAPIAATAVAEPAPEAEGGAEFENFLSDLASSLDARMAAEATRFDGIRAEVAGLVPEMADDPALVRGDNLAAAERVLDEARRVGAPWPPPSPTLALAGFTETPGTRVALHAARAVADEAGTRYNPFVVVGPAGAGKTHLLHGVANGLLARGIGPVACLSAVEFSDQLIAALDRNEVDLWRTRMRRLGALLVDDLEQLVGRGRTQEELFVLFNHLLERGAQLVFTSRERPAAIEGLEERLQSRLEGGLVAEVAPMRAPRRAVPAAVPLEALLSPERTIWDWPAVSDRVIEEHD
jgi:chromosomal replication initiation ATPase DnaA